jgi:hypothetical protein
MKIVHEGFEYVAEVVAHFHEGRPFYCINVLGKTIQISLHGWTVEEALKKLNNPEHAHALPLMRRVAYVEPAPARLFRVVK